MSIFVFSSVCVYAGAAAEKPKAPQIISVSNNKDTVSVKWKKVSGATSYVVYRKNDGKLKRMAVVAGNEYSDTNVKNNEAYRYYVKAYKNKTYSAYSDSKAIYHMAEPVHSNVKNTKEGIQFSWKAVTGAQKYYVYRRQNSQGWTFVKTVKAGSPLKYDDKNVKNNFSYKYTVRSVKGDSCSSFTTGKTITRLKTPVVTALTNSAHSIYIKWSAVSGAEGYALYRKQGESNWKKIAEIKNNSLSYSDNNVSHYKKYSYRVYAFKGGTLSAGSDVKAAVYLAPGEISSITNTRDGIKLKWNKMYGVTECILYRKTENSTEWSRLGRFRETSYTDKQVSHGVKYIYTLVQSDGENRSSYKSDGFSKIYLEPPVTFRAVHSPEGVKLIWSKVTKADGYTIYRKVQGDSSWKRVAVVKGGSTRTYYDNKASFGNVNFYRICAYASKSGAGYLGDSISIKAIDPNKKMVALTFDDGPYAPVTNQILDCLQKYGSRATFFVVGSRVDRYNSCVTRAYSLGNEIANHSYNHTTLTTASDDVINSEINNTNTVIRKYTGKSAAVVRAPGGAVNDRVRALVKYPLVNWSLDSLDWKTRDAKSTVSAIKNSVRDGDIVLMHDLYYPTAEAVCEIIPWLCKNGYQLVTVSELMQVKGVNFKAGNLYNNAY